MFSFIILVLGCRKDLDNQLPEIQISLPLALTTFQFNEKLPIKIHFSDNQKLQQLSIELIHLSDMRVLFSSRIFPKDKTYDYLQDIPLNDRYWPEGKMFLKVIANDGINSTTEIREFFYGEAPMEIADEWRVIANESGYSIFNLHDQWIHSESKEYAYSGYEPRSGKYWIAHHDGSLITRSLQTDYTISTITLESTPSCSFYATELEKYFIGGENGAIWIWQNGNTQSFRSADNKKVRQICSLNDYLFVWKEEPVTEQDYIFVYNIHSGALVNSVISVINIQSIAELNAEQIVVAGNENGSAKFGLLQYNSVVISENFTLTEQSAIQNIWPALDGGIWGLHNNGLVYYNAGLANMQLVDGILAKKIIKDKVNQEHIIITDNSIFRINSQLNGTLIITQKNIIDYLILYNK